MYTTLGYLAIFIPLVIYLYGGYVFITRYWCNDETKFAMWEPNVPRRKQVASMIFAMTTMTAVVLGFVFSLGLFMTFCLA